jgi:DNA-binding helix-hairpin-helix protein with protein kinase domain
MPDKANARREKILAMVQASLHSGANGVAYPIAPLFHSSGAFAGFTMQKVGKRRPIHELYSPSSRRQQFSKADFRFLIRSALNVANAVAAVHSAGCVIGDINHSGILISQDAIAALIDADSFQFHFQGHTFRCAVGVPDFTPPELQGGRLDRTDRTSNHDAFGLAVVIFQMLFMGRHPFVGGYLGGGDMPMERAIAECRFTYSSDRGRTRMEAPPHVPSLEDIPPELANAFETAFSPKSLNGGRPTAADWCRLLKGAEAQIVRCQSSPSHHRMSGPSLGPNRSMT